MGCVVCTRMKLQSYILYCISFWFSLALGNNNNQLPREAKKRPSFYSHSVVYVSNTFLWGKKRVRDVDHGAKVKLLIIIIIYYLLLLLLLLLSSLLFEGVDHDLGQRRESALWAGIEVSF